MPRTVRSHSGVGPSGLAPCDTWEGTINGIDTNEILLPVLNPPESVEVGDDGTRILLMQAQASRGRCIRTLIEGPLRPRHASRERLLQFQAGLGTDDGQDPLTVSPDVATEISTCARSGYVVVHFADGVVNVSRVRKDDEAPWEKLQGRGKGTYFHALRRLVFTAGGTAQFVSVVSEESPGGTGSTRGVVAAPVGCNSEDIMTADRVCQVYEMLLG